MIKRRFNSLGLLNVRNELTETFPKKKKKITDKFSSSW